jgi:hypothetical protein
LLKDPFNGDKGMPARRNHSLKTIFKTEKGPCSINQVDQQSPLSSSVLADKQQQPSNSVKIPNDMEEDWND